MAPRPYFIYHLSVTTPELTYGIMETMDFEYRFGIYDKFIRDIIDFPHLVVLNKLNLF